MSPLQAEVKEEAEAVLVASEIAKIRKWRRDLLLSDCKPLCDADVVNGNVGIYQWEVSYEVSDIRSNLSVFDAYEVRWIHRDMNFEAHPLARLGRQSNDQGLHHVDNFDCTTQLSSTF